MVHTRKAQLLLYEAVLPNPFDSNHAVSSDSIRSHTGSKRGSSRNLQARTSSPWVTNTSTAQDAAWQQ